MGNSCCGALISYLLPRGARGGASRARARALAQRLDTAQLECAFPPRRSQDRDTLGGGYIENL
eukprot:2170539-Pyramimonas_sp.AAC.1